MQILGAAVEAVATAGEAIDVLSRFDIIVADYDLPDRDGVWLLEQATRLAPSIRRLPVRLRRVPAGRPAAPRATPSPPTRCRR
jgi:CheY-like chemotaxis protein